MFRLFRHVWHGNLPMDLLWTHVRHVRRGPTPARGRQGLPGDYIAVKLYAGPALHMTDATREAVRALVARAAAMSPVVLLETDLPARRAPRLRPARHSERHERSARCMTPRNNLGVQLDAIARARMFLGTCGGLAWLAPFLGVPTVAVYDDDALLAPHLLVARQAGERRRGRRVRAARSARARRSAGLLGRAPRRRARLE